MANAQSQTDVCNSALQKVGAASIVDITDNSNEARQCQIAYDSNRRDELRKYPWNFALKRIVLAPDATAPAFGYTYAYTMPSDCLRVLLPRDATLDWVVEGRKILTNFSTSPWDIGSGYTGATALALKYISDVEDVATFDASFYNILAISLAIDICEKLTNSNQKKQVLMNEYKDAIREARRADAFENLPDEPADDSYWLARY